MVTKKQLREEIDRLKTDNATLTLLLRAYMQSNHRLQDDIDVLNASLDACAAEQKKWAAIAHKADERRLEYVRANGEYTGNHEKAVG